MTAQGVIVNVLDGTEKLFEDYNQHLRVEIKERTSRFDQFSALETS